ncbi:MAG: SAM-dependent methyltransferase [Bacteroidetes bacterium]|nr:SAM-dependent methyltransferase [Bacteroidota bacterium]
MAGVLYLVPNTLGNPDTTLTIPAVIPELTGKVKVYIVENLRNARRYLKSLDRSIDIDELLFYELNEHTAHEEIPGFLEEVSSGADAAVLSEAGVPGVADPGALVVKAAHEKGIRVVPLTGPSSILLSLMASGMNGQAFTFHGYISVKRPERIRKIKEMEQQVKRRGETQLFIEAPYRNDGLLSDIIDTLDSSTLLCIAADITMDTEFILTKPVAAWRKEKNPSLHKRPVIFLIGN